MELQEYVNAVEKSLDFWLYSHLENQHKWDDWDSTFDFQETAEELFELYEQLSCADSVEELASILLWVNHASHCGGPLLPDYGNVDYDVIDEISDEGMDYFENWEEELEFYVGKFSTNGYEAKMEQMRAFFEGKFICGHCNERFDELNETADGINLCDDCLEECNECYHCEGKFYNQDMETTIDDVELCNDCFYEYAEECEKCGEYFYHECTCDKPKCIVCGSLEVYSGELCLTHAKHYHITNFIGEQNVKYNT